MAEKESQVEYLEDAVAASGSPVLAVLPIHRLLRDHIPLHHLLVRVVADEHCG